MHNQPNMSRAYSKTELSPQGCVQNYPLNLQWTATKSHQMVGSAYGNPGLDVLFCVEQPEESNSMSLIPATSEMRTKATTGFRATYSAERSNVNATELTMRVLSSQMQQSIKQSAFNTTISQPTINSTDLTAINIPQAPRSYLRLNPEASEHRDQLLLGNKDDKVATKSGQNVFTSLPYIYDRFNQLKGGKPGYLKTARKETRVQNTCQSPFVNPSCSLHPRGRGPALWPNRFPPSRHHSNVHHDRFILPKPPPPQLERVHTTNRANHRFVNCNYSVLSSERIEQPVYTNSVEMLRQKRSDVSLAERDWKLSPPLSSFEPADELVERLPLVTKKFQPFSQPRSDTTMPPNFNAFNLKPGTSPNKTGESDDSGLSLKITDVRSLAEDAKTFWDLENFPCEINDSTIDLFVPEDSERNQGQLSGVCDGIDEDISRVDTEKPLIVLTDSPILYQVQDESDSEPESDSQGSSGYANGPDEDISRVDTEKPLIVLTDSPIQYHVQDESESEAESDSQGSSGYANDPEWTPDGVYTSSESGDSSPVRKVKCRRRRSGVKRSRQTRIITAENRAICEICGKMLHKHSLPNHLSYHRFPPTPCSVCGKVLSTHMGLRQHERQHLQQAKSTSTVKCSFISERKRMTDAELHRRMSVSHDKPIHLYACSICRRKFKTTKALNLHILMHADEMLAKCPSIRL